MWNWVKNAVSWAGNAVKKTVNAVKNASRIIDNVSNASVSDVVNSASSVNRVSEVRNVATPSSSWKESYRKVTNELSNTLKG